MLSMIVTDTVLRDIILERDRLKAEIERLVKQYNDIFNEWEEASGEAARLRTKLERVRDWCEQNYDLYLSPDTWKELVKILDGDEQ